MVYKHIFLIVHKSQCVQALGVYHINTWYFRMEEDVQNGGPVYVTLSIVYPILAFYVIVVNFLELVIIARLKRNICSILVAR